MYEIEIINFNYILFIINKMELKKYIVIMIFVYILNIIISTDNIFPYERLIIYVVNLSPWDKTWYTGMKYNNLI